MILAAALGLSSADIATVGATAAGLEHTFGIGTIEIGLLATVTSAVGAVATIPAGMVVDSGRNPAHLLALAGLLLVAGVVLLVAGRRTCPRDFATAVASEANLDKHEDRAKRRWRRRRTTQ